MNKKHTHSESMHEDSGVNNNRKINITLQE